MKKRFSVVILSYFLDFLSTLIGADGAKARSPKRSDGSLRGPTGELKLLAAQHEAGAARPLGRVDRSADGCADSVPLGCTSLGEAKEGTRMLRRPQRTEDRLRAGGEDGAYLRAPPCAGIF